MKKRINPYCPRRKYNIYAKAPYGPELILDLHGCDVSMFNRKSLRQFARGMCKEIGMTPHKFASWDDDSVAPEECQTKPETKGHTGIGVQFLMESSILIHALELRREAFVNVFSCKQFDRFKAKRFAKKWFRAERITSRLIIRG